MIAFMVLAYFYATLQTDFPGMVWFGAFLIDLTAWSRIFSIRIFKKGDEE